jgi:hypothetical protein
MIRMVKREHESLTSAVALSVMINMDLLTSVSFLFDMIHIASLFTAAPNVPPKVSQQHLMVHRLQLETLNNNRGGGSQPYDVSLGFSGI